MDWHESAKAIQGIDPEKNAESALEHAQLEPYWGARGRLQAAHLSGPRSSVPDAASSGPTLKAPGSAGGYLLSVKPERTS